MLLELCVYKMLIFFWKTSGYKISLIQLNTIMLSTALDFLFYLDI